MENDSVTPSATGRLARMVSEQVADTKEKLADLGRKTVDRIDDSREPAASALNRTASSLQAGADQLSGTAHSAVDKIHATASSAADQIQATAEYVRTKDTKGMLKDVQVIVKRYPAQSLAAAAILGFLVGRGLRSTD
jgi:ElaB/YqjD/DUF883 family membrane-anchored ribosome-binding protein